MSAPSQPDEQPVSEPPAAGTTANPVPAPPAAGTTANPVPVPPAANTANPVPAPRSAPVARPALAQITTRFRVPARWLRARVRRPDGSGRSGGAGEAVGRGFARLTSAPAIGMIAWLVPGLPLLLAGEFLPVPMVLIAAPLATALAVNVLHRVPSRWPKELPGPNRDRGWMSWWAIIGTAVVAAGFTAWQLAQNSPSVIVSRTPGVYFQTGYWIAQHGSLPITQSFAVFGGPQPGLHLSSIGFAQVGHSVVPAVTAGLPMLLTAGFWTSGIGGGAAVGPVIGGLAVLSFGGLAGRLAGRQWAPAGALVLALTLPELYTSRDSFSETAVQVLLFGGLSLVIDALTLSRSAEPEQQRRPAETGLAETAELPETAAGSSRWSSAWRRTVQRLRKITWHGVVSLATGSLTPERIAAALGGLSLGLTSLLSPVSLVLLLPAIPVAGVLVAARRAVGVAFCAGILTGTGYGIGGGYLLARPVMDSLVPSLELAGAAGAGLAVVTIGVLRLLRSPRASGTARKILARRPLRWLPGLGGIVVIATIAGLAVRPYLQTVRGRLNGTTAHYVAALQQAEHLRIDPARLYAEDTMYWVIWYAGTTTVLLGAFGCAAVVRRCLRAMLNWQDPSGARINWALGAAVLLGGSAVILWAPHTVPDQPWASRRLVPAVIPVLILFATWAAAWLTRRARERGAGLVTAAAVGMFCVGAMVLPSASTSFGFGLTHTGTGGGLRPSAGGLAQHRVAAGEADAVRSLCASIGRSSSVVIVDRPVAQMFTQAIRGICGVPVAWMAPGTPAAELNTVLSGIARAGRRPVVLGARPGQVAGYGGQPVLVLNLATTQGPHELTQPPGAPWPARYVIWMAAGNLPNIGV